MAPCWRAMFEKCCSAVQKFRQLLVEAQWSAAWYRVQSRRSHQSWTELLMRPLTPCWRWGHTASHLEPITPEGLWHRPSSQTPIAPHAHALLSNTALTTLSPTFLCFSQQNSLHFPHVLLCLKKNTPSFLILAHQPLIVEYQHMIQTLTTLFQVVHSISSLVA